MLFPYLRVDYSLEQFLITRYFFQVGFKNGNALKYSNIYVYEIEYDKCAFLYLFLSPMSLKQERSWKDIRRQRTSLLHSLKRGSPF